MRISDIYNNSNIQPNLPSGEITADASHVSGVTPDAGEGKLSGVRQGDIIEGVISDISRDSAKVSFQNGKQEISFSKDNLKNAFVGQKRAFEVIENTPGKLVLRDLGAVGSETDVRALQQAYVDTSLVGMANDFAENNGGLEKEDDGPIERLTDEDVSELRKEGFSIEDFNAERLVRAIDRVKAERAARKNSIDSQTRELREERKAVNERAARAVADKYAASQAIAEKLLESDLPATEANIAQIAGAYTMTSERAAMTDNSFAYMIKNELAPTIQNIYTSVYSGSIKRGSIDDHSWNELRSAARAIVAEANGQLGEEALRNAGNAENPSWAGEAGAGRAAIRTTILEQAAKPAETKAQAANQAVNQAQSTIQAEDQTQAAIRGLEPASEEDARWLLEYDIPLNRENLVYKKELEELKANGRNEDEVTGAAARAIARGEKAEDAILIASHEAKETGPSRSISELTSILRLQEIRLSMAVESGPARKIGDIAIDAEALKQEIDELRIQVRNYYTELAYETGIGDQTGLREGTAAAGEISLAESIDAAMKTSAAVEDIESAPLSFYRQTFSIRTTVTLESLSDTARNLRMDSIASGSSSYVSVRALAGYESSATEIRTDLGDSIRKAFGNVDSLIEGAGLELTEANRRAVRILGYNSMEITAENITEMKYYDAKLTTMVEGMKPSIVMSMIRRGFNPLDKDIDTINDQIRGIMADEGYSPEERFSSFLVRLEQTSGITASQRDAYIGIYRLLYQIEKNDGAAIGAALNSGRELTLANLLTESRTRRSSVDTAIDDQTDIRNTNYTNSISDQIRSGFAAHTWDAREYNVNLAEQALEITEPASWLEALDNENYQDLTLEQVTEMLQNADKHYDGINETAAAVRNIFASAPATRRFLKNLGVDDSASNIGAFDDNAALPVNSRDELLDAMEGREGMQALYEKASEELQRNTEAEFIGGIAILTRGREIEEQLARYDLLGQMAGHEHYRLNVANNGNPARINLTVIHNTGRAGTVSLDVSTPSYSLKADLSLTIFSSGTEGAPGSNTGRIDGRISTDSISELDAIATPLSAFITAMHDKGYDTTGISTGADGITSERYMGRVGELARRAAADTTAVERGRRGNASTERLYAVARSFLSFFL